MNLNGTIALVTGGGSGLGEATAHRLAAAGARVAVLDLSLEAARRVAGDVNGEALAADVSNAADVEAAFEKAIQALGGAPRVVVSCAGIGTASRILPRDGSLTTGIFDRTIQVNLMGTYAVMNVAARAMAAAEPLDEDGTRGVIVNTASVAFEDGQIGQVAYSASKGGVVSMTLPAARDLSRAGIRVMTIAPGTFDTPMLAGLPEKARVALAAAIPNPARLGDPAEFGALVGAIVDNGYLNGEVIRLDGALRMAPK